LEEGEELVSEEASFSWLFCFPLNRAETKPREGRRFLVLVVLLDRALLLLLIGVGKEREHFKGTTNACVLVQ
jgi:hypothetical protein